MIVFTRSETFDFDNLLEDFAKFAMMHKTKILDVGERITDVARILMRILKRFWACGEVAGQAVWLTATERTLWSCWRTMPA